MTTEEFFDLLNVPEPFVDDEYGQQPELYAGERTYTDSNGDAITVRRHAVCYEVVHGGHVLTIPRSE